MCAGNTGAMRNCPSQLIHEPTDAKCKMTFYYLIEIETVIRHYLFQYYLLCSK